MSIFTHTSYIFTCMFLQEDLQLVGGTGVTELVFHRKKLTMKIKYICVDPQC